MCEQTAQQEMLAPAEEVCRHLHFEGSSSKQQCTGTGHQFTTLWSVSANRGNQLMSEHKNNREGNRCQWSKREFQSHMQHHRSQSGNQN